MQAITVKYLGPTDSKGARYKATTAAGDSVTLPCDHSLSPYKNAEAAARHLVVKLAWKGRYWGGSLATGWVFVPEDLHSFFEY